MHPCKLCESNFELTCSDCQQHFCQHCSFLYHLIDQDLSTHNLQFICQECESSPSDHFCEHCDQNLCSSCDKIIHNKGKRALHRREPRSSEQSYSKIQRIIYLSFGFIKTFLTESNLEQLKEHLHHPSSLQYDSFLDKDLYLIFPEDSPDLDETLRALKGTLSIKNLLLISRDDVFRYKKLNENFQNQTDFSLQAAKFFIKILSTHLSGLNSVCLFDDHPRSALSKILHQDSDLKSVQIFTNFLHSNSPFETEEFESENSISSTLEESSGSAKHVLQIKTFRDQNLLQVPSEAHLRAGDKVLDSLNNSKTESESYWNVMYKPSPSLGFDELIRDFSSYSHREKITRERKTARRTGPIAETQPFKEVKITDSIQMSFYLQERLMEFASTGTLLIPREDLIAELEDEFSQTFDMPLEKMLTLAEEAKIVHVTVRKFFETEPITYYGLLLEEITVEALTWAIRSIKRDLMTPSERLVISRIKECFGMRIDLGLWGEIMNELLPKNRENKPEGHYSHSFYVQKFHDPVAQTDSNAIYLKDEPWTSEDYGQVDESLPEWQSFLQFLFDFYDENQKNKPTTWASSIENTLHKRRDPMSDLSDEVRAIPGGRYGCAQFIKVCGPEILKIMSIGKLCLFVQEAINKAMIKYEKTLLVKNNLAKLMNAIKSGCNGGSQPVGNSSLAKTTKLVKRIKEIISGIVLPHRNGVPLAQIPLMLRKKLGFNVNFQDLGFPKLKNFIQTMMTDSIKIESAGNNHSYAIPVTIEKNEDKKSYKPKTQNNSYCSSQNTSQVNQSQTSTRSRDNETEQPVSVSMFSKGIYGNKKQGYASDPSLGNNIAPRILKKNPSNLDDYLKKVRLFLEETVKEYPYGVALDQLQRTLSAKLGFEFSVEIFDCPSFYEFLLNYADYLVDIEIKKNMVVIYPKHFRFGPPQIAPIRAFPNGMNVNVTPVKSKQMINPNSKPFYSADQNKSQFESPPGLGPGGMQRDKPMMTISPLIFYSQDEGQQGYEYGNDMMKNIQYPGPCHLTVSNLNTAVHSRNGSNAQNRMLDESGNEIRENLKFIENLLQENEHDNSNQFIMKERSEYPSFIELSKGNNMAELSLIDDGQRHGKTQSYDFAGDNRAGFGNGQKKEWNGNDFFKNIKFDN